MKEKKGGIHSRYAVLEDVGGENGGIYMNLSIFAL